MKSLRILLADDDQDIRELVAEAIGRRGHTVETVEGGRELLERLKDGPSGFDVIVTDNDMRGGPSGLEVLILLRRHRQGFEDIPLILHSANPSPQLRMDVAAVGGAFCSKLSGFTCLLAALDELAKD